MSLMVSAATSVTFHVYHCIHCWDLSRLGHESDVVVVVGRWGAGRSHVGGCAGVGNREAAVRSRANSHLLVSLG